MGQRSDQELLSYYQNEQASIKNGTGFSSDQGYADLINNKVNEYTQKTQPVAPIVSQPIQTPKQQTAQPTQPAGQTAAQSTAQPTTQQTQQQTTSEIPTYTQNSAYNTQPVYQEIANTKPFQSQYTDQIQQLSQAAQTPFKYDPYQDTFLQQAQNQAMNAVTTEMNRRGIANSDQSRYQAYQQASSLVPQYEAMAYQRYNDNITNQLKTAQFLQQVTMDDYQVYKDSISSLYNKADLLNQMSTQDLNQYKTNMQTMFDAAAQKLNERKQALDETDKQLKWAQERVESLGYVDNEASIILGMAVGTPSKYANQLMQKLITDVQLEKTKTDEQIKQDNNNHENDLKTLDYKQQIIEQERQKQAQTVGVAFSQMANLTIEEAINTWMRLADAMIPTIGVDGFQSVTDMLQKMKNAKDDSEYKDKQITLQQANVMINEGRLRLDQQTAADASARGWASVDVAKQNAATSAMNAETSRMNAQGSGSGNSSDFTKYIEENFKTSESQKIYDSSGAEKTTSKNVYDKEGIGQYLGALSNMTDASGNPVISADSLSKLASKYGLSMQPAD